MVSKKVLALGLASALGAGYILSAKRVAQEQASPSPTAQVVSESDPRLSELELALAHQDYHTARTLGAELAQGQKTAQQDVQKIIGSMPYDEQPLYFALKMESSARSAKTVEDVKETYKNFGIGDLEWYSRRELVDFARVVIRRERKERDFDGVAHVNEGAIYEVLESAGISDTDIRDVAWDAVRFFGNKMSEYRETGRSLSPSEEVMLESSKAVLRKYLERERENSLGSK